jgi:uncharacterized protein YndB with AHSA1/START domain
MVKDLIITRSIQLNAGQNRVWEALTHPGMTKFYLFNCSISSEWQPGSTISFKGNYKGINIDRKGEILEIVPEQLLQYTIFDFDRLRNKDSNQIKVTYRLTAKKDQTLLTITLDNFDGDEARAEQVANTWDLEVFPKLKTLIETTL